MFLTIVSIGCLTICEPNFGKQTVNAYTTTGRNPLRHHQILSIQCNVRTLGMILHMQTILKGIRTEERTVW